MGSEGVIEFFVFVGDLDNSRKSGALIGEIAVPPIRHTWSGARRIESEACIAQ